MRLLCLWKFFVACYTSQLPEQKEGLFMYDLSYLSLVITAFNLNCPPPIVKQAQYLGRSCGARVSGRTCLEGGCRVDRPFYPLAFWPFALLRVASYMTSWHMTSLCHGVICHDIICHDVICHNVICHDIIFHDLTYQSWRHISWYHVMYVMLCGM